MPTNFERVVIAVPQPNFRLNVAAQTTPRISVAVSPPLRVQSAFDVDMGEATDGAVLMWNGGSRNFEAKTSLRNQSVDGGNF